MLIEKYNIGLTDMSLFSMFVEIKITHRNDIPKELRIIQTPPNCLKQRYHTLSKNNLKSGAEVCVSVDDKSSSWFTVTDFPWFSIDYVRLSSTLEQMQKHAIVYVKIYAFS